MIKGVFEFLKSWFSGAPDSQAATQASTDDSHSLKQRTLEAVAADQHDPILKGPRGGLYRLDANGRKVYLRQTSATAAKPRRARRRRHRSSKAS